MPNVPALAKLTTGEMTMPQAVALLEKRMITEAMRQTAHNYSRAAQVLGVTRRQLTYKMRGYGLAKEFPDVEPEVLPPRRSGYAVQVSVNVSVDALEVER